MSDLWNDPVFKPGDQIVCRDNTGYPALKIGETYIVDGYLPRHPDTSFTWPAYVDVTADGRRWRCHAFRFRLADADAAAAVDTVAT